MRPVCRGSTPFHAGNGLDGAYASDLNETIAELGNIAAWVHGHTHIRRVYRIGETRVYVNCRGFDGKDLSPRGLSSAVYFDVRP